jgi:hypothetical protein
MNGKISDIIDVKAIQKQVDETKKALESLSTATDKIAANLQVIGKKTEATKVFKELNEAQKEANVEGQKAAVVIAQRTKLQEQLDQLTQKLNRTVSEEEKELVRVKEALRLQNLELKNSAIQDNAKDGSVKQMRASLSLLTAEYHKMSEAERQSAKGMDLQKKISDTSSELKKVEAGLGDFRRNVGDYAGQLEPAFTSLRSEMRKTREELAGILLQTNDGSTATAEQTARIKELEVQLGKLTDLQGDIANKAKTMASDTSGIDKLNAGVTTLTGTMQIGKGAMESLGLSTEKFDVAMRKMAGLASINQGFNQLKTNLQDGSAFMELFGGRVGKLINWFKGLGTAMKFLTGGGILLAVTLVIAGFQKLSEAIGNILPAQRELNKLAKESAEIEKQRNARAVEWEKGAVERLKLEQTISSETSTQAEKLAAINQLGELNKNNAAELVKEREREVEIAKKAADTEINRVKWNDVLSLGIGRRGRLLSREEEQVKKIQEAEKGLAQARTELYNQEKKHTDDVKDNEDELAQNRKKYAEDRKQREKEIADAAKSLRDLNNSMITDELEREKAQLKANLEDQVAAVKGTEEQKIKQKAALNKKYIADIKKLDEDAEKDKAIKGLEVEARRNNAELALLAEFDMKRFDLMKQQAEKEKQIKIKNGEDLVAVQAEYDAQIIEIDTAKTSAIIANNESIITKAEQRTNRELKEIEARQYAEMSSLKLRGASAEEIANKENENAQEILDYQISAIKKQLENEALSVQQREQLSDQLRDVEIENEKQKQDAVAQTAELNRQKIQENFEMAQEVITQLMDFATGFIEDKIEADSERLGELKNQNDEWYNDEKAKLDDMQMSDTARAMQQKALDEEKAQRDRNLAAQEAELKTRQAKLDKARAIADATMSMSKAIINATASGAQAGLLSPATIAAFNAIVIALSAANLAKIIATPIPKYEHGGTNISGIGLWGEKRPEVAVDKKGNTMLATIPTITEFAPGTTIYPSIEKYMQAMGEGRHTSTQIDYDRIDAIMEKHKAVQTVNLDHRGLYGIITKQGERQSFINQNFKSIRK